MDFKVTNSDGFARTGELATGHGVIRTPAFMPIATRGAVRRLSFDMMEGLGNDIFLANTYHLALRPGHEIVRDLGGLHGFTGWSGPWITDSGGFQVFSLSSLSEVTDAGVTFKSHLDGSAVFLGPKESMEIQTALGADICMTFDECIGADADEDRVRAALERTHRWADVCLEHRPPSPQALYGIVQGGMNLDLRAESRDFMASRPFDGLAMGGLAVGEGHDTMLRILESVPLPAEKPRYLMGVGWPRDILAAVACGYDQFDCVLPTRNGRNGSAFSRRGKENIKRKDNQRDDGPLDPDCSCPVCQRHSRGYLHHLLHVNEVLGGALISLHNLHFYEDMMAGARQAIQEQRFEEYAAQVTENFHD